MTHLIPGHCIFSLGISVIPGQQAWLNEISKHMEYKLIFSYKVILNWYFIISYTNKSIKRLFRCHLGLFWLLTGYFGYSYHHLVTLVSSTNKTDRCDIAEILLKVALNTITLTHDHTKSLPAFCPLRLVALRPKKKCVCFRSHGLQN